MGMRKRYDVSGKCIGANNMIYDEIPDDYAMKKVILDDKVFDLSYLGVMKHLRSMKVDECFEDDAYYSKEVIGHMAMDYLESALYLQNGIVADRGGEVVTYYFVPCAFLCKHAIELKLKECLLSEGAQELRGHSVLQLWKQLVTKDFPKRTELENFLVEVEKIDKNEMALRYGISKDLTPLSENFKFDIDSMLMNTKYLFNVLDEYVVHGCKWDGLCSQTGHKEED